MISSLIYIFHQFNRFLGTPAGELLKRFSELLLLAFACYMVASEWLRSRTKDLRYLLIGFGSLAVQKLIATIFLGQVVFAGIAIRTYQDYISISENFLEISALILISSAFLYPVHKKHGISLRSKTYIELAGAALVFVFAAAVALGIIPLPLGSRRLVILSLMELSKFFILWFPVFIFWKTKELTAYNKAVASAFVVYSITPFLNMLNLAAYGGDNTKLAVLAHPFPFIAVALFARVLFLKLVDKAMLKEELISARKKYVREKEISTMKDEFVSTVSHELRTPLTSIRLYIDLLIKGKFGNVTEKQKETLMTLDNESSRLKSLIDDIFNLSRFEKNKETLVLKKTSLHKLVGSCIYPHLTEEKNISIKNNIPAEISIDLDPEKFRQVIINLLTNAIKHTDSGTVTFSASRKDDTLLFSISDTGRGIPPESLPYIFDKFYQAEGHMVRNTGGIGLGLAIVKKIVQLHKGRIEVTSELNKGTTFTITLPQQ
ncbi:HAMP domain-containing histidine kinase [Candidatus Woesearchaeota archaeon]|nr:HAMP domain-containing histidine kinase [Candidatus Woesearchaeota archaeon]